MIKRFSNYFAGLLLSDEEGKGKLLSNLALIALSLCCIFITLVLIHGCYIADGAKMGFVHNTMEMSLYAAYQSASKAIAAYGGMGAFWGVYLKFFGIVLFPLLAAAIVSLWYTRTAHLYCQCKYGYSTVDEFVKTSWYCQYLVTSGLVCFGASIVMLADSFLIPFIKFLAFVFLNLRM